MNEMTYLGVHVVGFLEEGALFTLDSDGHIGADHSVSPIATPWVPLAFLNHTHQPGIQVENISSTVTDTFVQV
jgi:hypothetical protein